VRRRADQTIGRWKWLRVAREAQQVKSFCMKEQCSFSENDDIIQVSRLSMEPRGMSQACERVALCRREEVQVGQALRIEKGQLVVAVFNLDGEFFVTDDACTHGPGSLSEGCVEGDIVECDFHNGAFNIRTGAVAAAPCMIPIKTYRTVVDEAGLVSIEV
jgi:nitrite reductase/ring-hydroxylating ferredoxin subunit